MTTATANKNVSSDMRSKAGQRARQIGENVVVYEAKMPNGDTTKTVQMMARLSIWEQAEPNENVTFLAVIDSNGNYVD